MPLKQAKIPAVEHIDDCLFFAKTTRHPLRNRVMVLLSVKTGLNPAAIANLTWVMVLDGSGGSSLELSDTAARMGHSREQ
jgi:integrase/recombinase XerD